MEYLPKDSPSTIAITAMENAFGNMSAVSAIRVLVQNVSVPEAIEYKSKISAIDSVSEVIWLDDNVDLAQPLSFINQQQLNTFYNDRNALFTVMFYSDLTINEKMELLSAIRKIIGDDNAMSGNSVMVATARQESKDQLLSMLILLVPLILFIMLISTRSWIEPLLFFIAIGVAIIINMGTNAFFKDISFITLTASSVLHLAVSIDYSIFFLHTLSEQRDMGLNPKDAIITSMKKSFPSIAASGVTTILGFVVLALMRCLIGADLGIVLAKGIVFSLISVMLLLPVLASLFYRQIITTSHRSFLPNFKPLANFILKASIPIMIITSILAIPSYFAQQKNSFIYGEVMSIDKSTRVGREEELINTLFGKQNQMILLVPEGDFLQETALANEFLSLPYMTNITSYVTSIGAEIPPESISENRLSQLISHGYSRMILSLNLVTESEESFAAVEEIRNISEKYYNNTYYLVGDSVSVYDMRDVVTQDNIIITFAAVIAIGLVILLTFRSISIPIMLVLVIEFAIWINLAMPYFEGNPIVYIGYIIISSVQLGATVDYAILYANSYLKNRRRYPVRTATKKAITQTVSSIFTSSVILFSAGMAIASISTNGIISQLGKLIGSGAALSSIVATFFLPGLLMSCDKLIQKTTLNLEFLSQGRSKA
jgi:predicted RND superfamily exporter protein